MEQGKTMSGLPFFGGAGRRYRTADVTLAPDGTATGAHRRPYRDSGFDRRVRQRIPAFRSLRQSPGQAKSTWI